ncbi:MAG TPA: hypothetical protein VF771_22010 [Longimicrobiaceae bacterium]
MSRALKLTLALVLATLGAAACVGKGRNAPIPQPATFVHVENQAWLDVDVYAMSGGLRRRLGLVNANSSARFRIPDSVIGIGRSLQFLVDPVGSSRTGTSFEIYVSPGQEVTLTVPPTLGR